MSWFPFNYRDLDGWKYDGVELSTTSNQAAKDFDALLSQVSLLDDDPQYGGFDKTLQKLAKEDPNWIMPTVVAKCQGGIFGAEVHDVDAMEKTPGLTKWEKSHIKALRHLSNGDIVSTVQTYDRILVDYPKDMVSLHYGFFIGLTKGLRQYCRDIPSKVISEYKPENRFYGNVHGKLIFGHEQCGQYDEAEKLIEKAMSHSPNDIWAIHSISHLHGSKAEAQRGIDFLEKMMDNWTPRSHLVSHVWWHYALLLVEKGEFQAALNIVDEKMTKKDKFEISDATSLLMRLELEGQPKGVDLRDRWREVANKWEEFFDMPGGFFYDFHNHLAYHYGGRPDKLTEELVKKIEEVGETKTHDGFIIRKVGVQVIEGLREFERGNYADCAEKLYPIRHDMMRIIGGSWAQLSILRNILTRACVRAGPTYRDMGLQLLEEEASFSYKGKMNKTMQRMHDALYDH